VPFIDTFKRVLKACEPLANAGSSNSRPSVAVAI
jgi:hypothetical protein